jgi:hypothetical protein
LGPPDFIPPPTKKRGTCPRLLDQTGSYGTENDGGPQAYVASGPPVETSYANFCAVTGYVQLASARCAPLFVRVFAGHVARWILRLQTALLQGSRSANPWRFWQLSLPKSAATYVVASVGC